MVAGGLMAISLVGTAHADGGDLVEVYPANAPDAVPNPSDERCIGYEGDRAFVRVNYPNGEEAAFVGQLYVNTLGKCLG